MKRTRWTVIKLLTGKRKTTRKALLQEKQKEKSQNQSISEPITGKKKWKNTIQIISEELVWEGITGVRLKKKTLKKKNRLLDYIDYFLP